MKITKPNYLRVARYNDEMFDRKRTKGQSKKLAQLLEQQGHLTRSEIAQLTGIRNMSKPSAYNLDMGTIDMVKEFAEQNLRDGSINLKMLEILVCYNTVPALARILGVTNEEISTALLGGEANS